MSLRRLSKKNTDIMKFDTYNSIRDQLEAQNEVLMQERKLLQRGFDSNPHIQSYNTIIQHSAGLSDDYGSSVFPTPSKKAPKTKSDKIKNKINQIISLCSAELNDPQGRAPEELKQIMEAEQQILTHLESIQREQKSLGASKKQFRKRSSATIGGSVRRIPQSNQKLTKNSQFQQQWQQSKSGIRQAFKTEGFDNMISDNVMEMIEAIERKALIELERLRNDKISLMKRLNKEIKENNEDKKARSYLQRQNAILKKQLERLGLRGTTFGPTFNHPLQKVEEEDEQTERAIRSRKLNTGESSKKVSQRRISQQFQDQYVQNQPEIPQQQQIYYLPQQSKPNIPSQVDNMSSSIRKKILKQTNGNTRFMSPQPFRQNQFEQQTSIIPSEQKLEGQIYRLQNQNKRIKSSIAHSQLRSPTENIKQKLRSEMLFLQQEIRKYERILEERSRKQENLEGSHIHSLLHEGDNIYQQGEKLMRIKSNPELSQKGWMTESKRQQFAREINFLKSRINTLKKQNQSMISQQKKFDQSEKKSSYSSYKYPSQAKVVFDPNPGRFYSPSGTNSSKSPSHPIFSANKYESLINQMKKATKY